MAGLGVQSTNGSPYYLSPKGERLDKIGQQTESMHILTYKN
jgi:hypothetical protein